MARRRVNYRFAKIDRNYTVPEICRRFGVHRNTVREWKRRGLRTIDDRRPMLIHGSDLREFLLAEREQNRRPCEAGQIYCVRCRVPRNPAGNIADFEFRTANLGDLVGICPNCEALMYRRVNLSKLDQVRGKLDVSFSQAPPRLNEPLHASVNRALEAHRPPHANAQSYQRTRQAPVLRLSQGGEAAQ